MKKLLPFFLLLLSVGAFGQKQLYFGISASGISTWITNQNNYGMSDLDYVTTFSWTGNVDIGFDFNKHLGLKTEVGMAYLGQKYTKDQDTIKRHVKLNYLMVPLLFKYKTGGEVLRFYLLAGFQAGFLLKAEQVYTENDKPLPWFHNKEKNDSIDVSRTDIKERYSSFQIFFRLDPGVEVTVVKNLVLHLGVTINYGLLDINATNWHYKDVDGNYNPSHNIYGGLNFGIAYAIPVGKKH